MTIKIVPYNSDWPAAFEKESNLIKKVFGSNCLSIHHIGSTSIPGLPAKPIIDILVVVKDILKVDLMIGLMEDLGYEVKGENGIAFRRLFLKSDPFTWTFENPHSIYFVFYYNTKIIGYSHLQLWPHQQANLRMIVIEHPTNIKVTDVNFCNFANIGSSIKDLKPY